jgi:hypothetical protein
MAAGKRRRVAMRRKVVVVAVIKTLASKPTTVTRPPKLKQLLGAIRVLLFNPTKPIPKSVGYVLRNAQPHGHSDDKRSLIDANAHYAKTSAKPPSEATLKSALQALTSAALVLPGLMLAPAHAAEDDSVDFQYSHYQEGKRDIYGPGGYNSSTNAYINQKLPGE